MHFYHEKVEKLNQIISWNLCCHKNWNSISKWLLLHCVLKMSVSHFHLSKFDGKCRQKTCRNFYKRVRVHLRLMSRSCHFDRVSNDEFWIFGIIIFFNRGRVLKFGVPYLKRDNFDWIGLLSDLILLLAETNQNKHSKFNTKFVNRRLVKMTWSAHKLLIFWLGFHSILFTTAFFRPVHVLLSRSYAWFHPNYIQIK